MAKYKLILTVQDSFGMTKEIEAGIIEDVEQELTDNEIKRIAESMDSIFATDVEVKQATATVKEEMIDELPEVISESEEVQQAITENTSKVIKYDSFTD